MLLLVLLSWMLTELAEYFASVECNLLGYDDYGSQGNYQCRENRD